MKNIVSFILLLNLLLLGSVSYAQQNFSYDDFAKIPILHEGRIKPIDSFARASLLLFSGKQSLNSVNAEQWLAELLFAPEEAKKRYIFKIPSPDVQNAINLEKRKKHLYSFSEVSEALKKYVETINSLKEKPEEARSLAQNHLIELSQKILFYLDLSQSFSDNRAVILRIIPPQWQQSGDLWMSPWESSQAGFASPKSSEYLNIFKKIKSAYKKNNTELWETHISEAKKFSYILADNQIDQSTLNLEFFYNKADLFFISIVLYIASFLIFSASGIFYQRVLSKLAFISLFCGGLAHLTGLIIRMVIMSRPPVTTLYESIIFVGLIAVVFALILERKRLDGLGIVIGSTVGAALQFIGIKYSAEGDTMGMLVAVLDTNFWLATHVVCMTIGYGACIVTAMLGHIYLVKRFLTPNNKKALENILKNMIGVALVALFFSLVGTILGGIWADQSWGRFWGWDPKENGAMLIVLWLIWILHGKIAGQLKNVAFSVLLALTNIIVALAWFGVNLLNIGLHSYGFTENIALNLGLFCAAEIIFVTVMSLLIKRPA